MTGDEAVELLAPILKSIDALRDDLEALHVATVDVARALTTPTGEPS